MYNKSAQIKVKIDGAKQNNISSNNPGIYTLAAGNHFLKIGISGLLGYSKTIKIEIKDRFTKIHYNVHCTFGNVIKVSQ